MDRSPRLEGNEWQVWAKKLLNARYKAGEYQHVPDKDKGDAGIEGFSLDGCAYQMYGPEGDVTFERRHEKIRGKVTADIAKFIKNRRKLSSMFGDLLINRWILLVPYFDSRALVEHAAKKTKEVLTARLPYVDSEDFRVVIADEDVFAEERDRLLQLGIDKIAVCSRPATDNEIDGWSDDAGNVEKAAQLEEKTRRLPTLASEKKRAEFRREVVRWWLDGQTVLEDLREYPDTWEAIRRVKSEQERYLKGHGMIAVEQPSERLMGALQKILEAVEEEVCVLAASSREAVCHEAVADWLMRCPLDFPE